MLFVYLLLLNCELILSFFSAFGIFFLKLFSFFFFHESVKKFMDVQGSGGDESLLFVREGLSEGKTRTDTVINILIILNIYGIKTFE